VPSATTKRKLRLKPGALNKMHEAALAAGVQIRPGLNGGINREAIFGGGDRTGTSSNLVSGKTLPHNTSVALISWKYAQWRGISWGQALEELFDNVPATAPLVSADAELAA
jgi:hypothetical protein